MDKFRLTPAHEETGLPFTIRLAPSLAKRIRAVAAKEKVTITSIFEVCLGQSLPKLEK